MILFIPPVRNVLSYTSVRLKLPRKELDASSKDMAKAPEELLNITENPFPFFQKFFNIRFFFFWNGCWELNFIGITE